MARWAAKFVVVAVLALLVCVANYYLDRASVLSSSEVMVVVVACWLAVEGALFVRNRLRRKKEVK
jgi:hypothetical protein